MPKFVVLLRGVNVGKAKRVPMAEFRALLEGLGYTEVSTLLNSGNAVFSSATKSTPAKHAASIRAALLEQLQVDVPVIVKSAKEMATAVAENTVEIAADLHSRFLVAFTQESGDLAKVAAVEPLLHPDERFAIGSQAAYLFCAVGILESQAGAAMLGKIGRGATTRNWATTLKLLALLDADRA